MIIIMMFIIIIIIFIIIIIIICSCHLSKHPSLCELFWYPSPDDGYWNRNVNVDFAS